MTRAEAARRYLQASMAANTTALPGDAKEAHEGTMARLEKQHPGAAELAVVGANTDFDRNLEPGEKEHQRYLRAGASSNELRARRERARTGRGPSPSPGRRPGTPAPRRSAVRAGVAGGRGYARARRTIVSSSGVQDTGSLVLQAVGVAIGLSLLYLTLSPNGSKAFSTLLNGVTKFMRLLISPVDPLNPSGHTVAATSTRITEPGGNLEGAPLAGGLGPAPRKTVAGKNRAFGVGPGQPNALIGVSP